jgi:hypothetical protein
MGCHPKYSDRQWAQLIQGSNDLYATFAMLSKFEVKKTPNALK